MAGFSKALQQPEYIHVLLNHFPITGLFVALLFLLAALVMNHRAAQLLGLAMTAVLALSAWPVAHFGQEGYDRVMAMSDDAGGQYLKHHAELADRWIFLYYTTAIAAAAALVVGWKQPKWLRPASMVVAVLTVASLGAGAVIADCGGKIRHREFRFGSPPASQIDGQLPAVAGITRARSHLLNGSWWGERTRACAAVAASSHRRREPLRSAG